MVLQAAPRADAFLRMVPEHQFTSDGDVVHMHMLAKCGSNWADDLPSDEVGADKACAKLEVAAVDDLSKLVNRTSDLARNKQSAGHARARSFCRRSEVDASKAACKTKKKKAVKN